MPEVGDRIKTSFTANDCLFVTYYSQGSNSIYWSLKISACDINNEKWVTSVLWNLGYNWNASVVYQMVTIKRYIVRGKLVVQSSSSQGIP